MQIQVTVNSQIKSDTPFPPGKYGYTLILKHNKKRSTRLYGDWVDVRTPGIAYY